MYIRKKITGSNQLSNKILLQGFPQQVLKVINYYCLQGMLWISRRFFLFFLNTIAGASTQSQAQVKIQSQAHAEAQAQRTTGHRHFPWMKAPSVIIYDESKPGDQVSW